MPLTFRKSKKIAGVRVNLGKRGISSISTGNRWIGSNFSRRGARHRISLPGSGLAYHGKAGGCLLPLLLLFLIFSLAVAPNRFR
jgi:hypothetical protein